MREWITSFTEKASNYLLAPFSSWDSFLSAISGVPARLTGLQSLIGWPYLLSSIAIAYVLYRLARKREPMTSSTSFGAFAFPRNIYRHRSAVVDYKYAAIDLTIQGVTYAPLVGGFSWLVYKTTLSIAGGGATAAALAANAFPDMFLLTLVTFLVADLGYFLSHYFMHRVPLLWHFHEVHHSAEVLTPVTVLRVHPVEKIVNGLVGGLLGGLSSAAYAAVSHHEISPLTVFGVNVFVFQFFVFAAHLRHSHIWLSYGRVLNHVFISPSQHQIHHSTDPKHMDKNYGYTLAIWDGLIGSLYVPRQRETLQFGLVDADPQDFSSVARLYFLPFQKAMRRRPAAEPIDTSRAAVSLLNEPNS